MRDKVKVAIYYNTEKLNLINLFNRINYRRMQVLMRVWSTKDKFIAEILNFIN